LPSRSGSRARERLIRASILSPLQWPAISSWFLRERAGKQDDGRDQEHNANLLPETSSYLPDFGSAHARPLPTGTASHAIHSIADMKRLALFALLPLSACLGADLALTPPMGWNSWNKFGDKIDDKTVREIADAMVSSGMKDAGYVYINIDDSWEGGRDKQGNIQTNSNVPDMKALADYVHSKGLKIGIYSSPGPKTCAEYEGSYQHEEQDARTWAAWGIDYLKYDWCSAAKAYPVSEMKAVYRKM